MKYFDTDLNKVVDIYDYNAPEYLISLKDLALLMPMLTTKEYNNIVFVCHNGPLVKDGYLADIGVDVVRAKTPEDLIIDHSTNLYTDYEYDKQKVQEYVNTIKSLVMERSERRKYISVHLADDIVEALDKLRIPSLWVSYGQVALHAEGRLIGWYKIAEEGALKDYKEVCKFVEENLNREMRHDCSCGTSFWFSASYDVERYLKAKYHLDGVNKIVYNWDSYGSSSLSLIGNVGLRMVILEVGEPRLRDWCKEFVDRAYGGMR